MRLWNYLSNKDLEHRYKIDVWKMDSFEIGFSIGWGRDIFMSFTFWNRTLWIGTV
jgi:hypothetical protein